MGKLGDRPTKLIQVSEGSVAERAGLIVGDVLLRINDQPVDSFTTLRLIFAPARWGDVITALVERDGEELELEIPIRRNTADQAGYQ
jgi:S1-C subfamily serine protease